MNKKEFINALKELNISVTPLQLEKLNIYYNLLIEENKKYNLTAITNKEDVYLKHFYDSLTLTKIITLSNQHICDIGTGAGFPGIVLKIIFPDLKVTLLDSTEKKCKFLKLIISKLNLNNIDVINERAEIYSKTTREKYEIATCRAVSHLNIISEIIIPMIKVKGYFLPLKGEIDREINEGLNILEKLNAQLIEIKTYKLPIENSSRSIPIIQKINTTATIYPREYNKIIKDLKNKQK